MLDRPRCSFNGCKNLTNMIYESKKTGKKSYLKLCPSHMREHYGKRELYRQRDLERKKQDYKNGKTISMYKKIDRSLCGICGWNKTICDQHRIVYGCNGGKYTTGNLISLCPNCHRLVHRGLLSIK